jgi:ABC-type transport system involved in multi-copper enzyme maturation permease subunit
MTFLPVAQRELMAASRRRLTFAVRMGAGGLAVAAGFIGLLATFAGGGRAAGGPVFQWVVLLSAFVIGVAGVLLTADCLSGERREGTLGFLFLTDLTGFDVLTGKLAAAAVNAAAALLAVFPVMAIALILGGVTAGEFWRCALALLNLLWVSLAIGLAVSSRTVDSTRALAAAAAWLVLLDVALPIAGAALRNAGGPAGYLWLSAPSPVEALIQARDSHFTFTPGSFWRSLAMSHLVGWALIGIAAWRLPRVWREGAGSEVSAKPTARRVGFRFGDAENPIVALHRPSVRERWLVWTIVGLTFVAAGLLWDFKQLGSYQPLLGAMPFSPAYFLFKLLFAWRCCCAFHRFRQGSGELLLTTPISEKEVLDGAWAGTRALVQLPLALLVAANLVLPLLHAMTDAGSAGVEFVIFPGLPLNLYGVGTLIVDLMALAWLSARFSLRSKGPMSAFGLVIALLFVPRLLLFCLPDLIVGFVLLQWARNSVTGKVREFITGDRRPTTPAAFRPGWPVPGTV